MADLFDPEFLQSLKDKAPVGMNQMTGTTINNNPTKDITLQAKGKIYSERMNIPQSEAEEAVPELDQATKEITMDDRKRSIKAQYEIADLNVDINFMAYDMLMGRGDSRVLGYNINRLEKQIARESKYILDDNIFQKALNATATILPPMKETMGAGIKLGGYAAMGAMTTAAVLGQLGPQVLVPEEIVTMPVAGATAFMVGSRIQAARLTAQMEAGAAYWNLSKLKDDEGNTLSPELLKGVSHSIGAINGLLETAGLSVLFKNIPGLKQIGDKLIGNVVEDAVKKGVVRKLMLAYAKQYPKTVGAETGVELAQELTNVLGEEIAKKLSDTLDGTNMPEMDKDKVMDQLWQTIETTALGMSVIGAPGPITNVAIESVADHRSVSAEKNPTALDVLPANKISDPGKELVSAYRGFKNTFLGNRDIKLYKNKIAAGKLKKELDAVLTQDYGKHKKEDVVRVNSAIQLYLDAPNGSTKAKRVQALIDNVAERGEELEMSFTQEQLDLWEASRNLTDNQKAFAAKMQKTYNDIGKLSFEDGVIRNIEDNYAARQWDLGLPDARQVFSTFHKNTKHAQERIFPTIMHGLAQGMTLKVPGATENLALYKDTMIKTFTQRKFFNAVSKVKIETKVDGKVKSQALFTPFKRKGYQKANIDGWRIYAPMSSSVPGMKLLETADGTKLWETSVYAPREVVADMNALFGISKLKQIEGKPGVAVEVISRWNAILKTITLSLSGFHAFAYMRSYYLGGPIKWTDPKSRNVIRAYRDGVRMMQNMDEIVQLGVKNGLTLALQQDWQREYLDRTNKLSMALDKLGVVGKTKDKLVQLNDMWLGFLFSSFGSGLKVKTFALDLKHELARNPQEDPNAVAARVASLVNDDYGGLHLERMGRNPTLQHMLQLSLLAPDWSESNLRTVTGLFRKTGDNPKAVRQLYRRFWARIVTKGLVATSILNVAVSLAFSEGEEKWSTFEAMVWDIQKSYSKTLRRLGKGNIRRGWEELVYGTSTVASLSKELFSVNITPIYQAFGGSKEVQKYFSIFGHFMDPLKFARHPNRVLRHKQSIAAGMVWEYLSGEDWAGRRFTSLPELLQGEGLTTYESPYNDGIPIFDTWFISYFLSQIIGHSPVGAQNLISSISGETDYFDSILSTAGIQISTAH